MANDDNNSSSRKIYAIGIVGLVMTFTLGPIDGSRTVYNHFLGDSEIMKKELVDYTRNQIGLQSPSLDEEDVEKNLAHLLRTTYTPGEKVDGNNVSSELLWDATEEVAPSFFENWVWTRINNY